MKRIGKYCLILLILFIIPCTVLPSERSVNISAAVDASEVGLLDTLTLTVNVETENITRISKPEIPEMKFFTVLNESSSSRTSISIVNGKTTRAKTTTFIYVLKPEEKGTFTIDPVRVKYSGSVYKTDPITVTVVEGQLKPGVMQNRSGDEQMVDIDSLKENIFIRAETDKTHLYEGEQLLLTYTLYSRLDIDSVSLRQNPKFPGFFIEDIYSATRLEYKKETYKGRIFTSSLIKKVALFPLKAGRYVPDPLVLETTVILKKDDLFDLFGYPYSFTIESNAAPIEVLPLPPNTADTPFSGIVGELTAVLLTPTTAVSTGESTTCYLTLKSTGNLNVITDPKLELSLRGRVFLSDTMHNTVEEKNNIYLIKKFEYTIIPEESGALTINSPELLCFDIKTGNYVFTKAKPVQLTVTGKNIVRERPLRDRERSLSRGSLRFIKKDVKTLKNRNISPLQNPFYYLYHFSLLVFTALLFVIKIKKEKLEKNEGLFRKLKARAGALEVLHQTGQYLDNKKLDEAINSISRALITYIADKTEKKPQDITAKNIQQILDALTGIKPTTKENIQWVLDTCMKIKFSSSGAANEELVHDLKRKAVDAVNEMEAAVGKK